MNPDSPEASPDPQPGEIERLKAEHDRLHEELETIQTRLSDLSLRLDTLSKPKPRQVQPRKRRAANPGDDEALHATAEPAPVAPPQEKEPDAAPVEKPAPDPELPPVPPDAAPAQVAGLPTIPDTPESMGETLARAKDEAEGAPTLHEKLSAMPPIPGSIPETAAAPPPTPEPPGETALPPVPPDEPPAPAMPPLEQEDPFEQEESMEARWVPFLIKIAFVVLFLLTLIFAGNYVYTEFVAGMGPGMKVFLLYVLCAVFLGVGAWMEGLKSGLRHLGTTLGAGGLAGLYYVTFAAHHTERLRVIENPYLAASLLLLWAGLTFGLAHWRQSQALAITAVALAYFSTAIGPVGWFSAGSNLGLAILSVVLQLRHRWYVLGAISLVGVYASFLCNTVLGVSLTSGEDPLAPLLAYPEQALLIGLFSLTAYWLTYTVSAFFSRPELVPAEQRTGLLTFNNLLWVGLGWLLLARLDMFVYKGEHLMAAGALMLIASCLARWQVAVARPTADAYLAQGLAAFTAGLMLAFSGSLQAVLLAVELLIVLILATSSRHPLLRHATLVIAPLVTGTALMALELGEIAPTASLSVAATLIFAGWWAKFHRRETSWRQEQVDWLTANGLGLLTCALITHFSGTPRLLLLTTEFVFVLLFAVGSTSYLLRVASHLFATIVLAVASGYLLLHGPDYSVVISIVALFWAAWWAQHQTLARHKWTPADIGWLSALALVLFYQWLKDILPPEHFWPALAGVGVLLTVGTRLHRIPTLTFLSQVYYLLAVTNVAGPLYDYQPGNPAWWVPASLVAFGLLLSAWWQRTTQLRNEDFSFAMRLIDAACVVTLIYLWVEPRVTTDQWMYFASALTVLLSAYGWWRREWILAAFGQGLVLVAVGELFWKAGAQVHWGAALIPTITMIGLAIIAEWALRRHRLQRQHAPPNGAEDLLVLVSYAATLYRIAAVFLGVRLVNAYIPLEERAWVFTAIGFALFATNGWRMNNFRFLGVALYFVIPMAHWFMGLDEFSYLYWPNWIALGAILVAPNLTRHVRENLPPLGEGADVMRRERRDWEENAIFGLRLTGVLMLWLQMSRLLLEWFGPEYLTIAWALTALLVLGGGFLARERLLRWLGLLILAAALLRFLSLDLWGFDTLYQLVSSGVLTGVLLLLAFLYFKYAKQIRDWL